jgi:anti-anti-sigma factor
MPDPPLQLSVDDADGSTRLSVRGEIDMATAEQLCDQLTKVIDDHVGDVDIDLSLVTFCDSTGLRVMLNAHHQLLVRGRRLRVVCASRPVQRLLELSATNTVLTSKTSEHPVSPTVR